MKSGVGNWVRPAPITEGGTQLTPGDRGGGVIALQEALSEYGYGIAVTGSYNSITHDVVAAFQRHFRPDRIDGIGDQSTIATLRDLLAHRNRPKTIAARSIVFERLVVAS